MSFIEDQAKAFFAAKESVPEELLLHTLITKRLEMVVEKGMDNIDDNIRLIHSELISEMVRMILLTVNPTDALDAVISSLKMTYSFAQLAKEEAPEQTH